MGVLDENLPGGGTVINPSGAAPGNLQNILQLLAMMKGGNTNAPSAPAPPMTPGAPGGAPPNILHPQGPSGTGTPGMSSPMPVSMSPYQAGGPAARGQVQGYQGPTEFRSPQARTGAVVDSAIKSLQSFAMQHKQHAFEQEASQAQVIALASIAKQKQQAGEQLTAQDMQAIEAAAKLEKKAPKIVEKAMTDPMSGAYVGVQRAYATYQQREEAKLKQQQVQAQIAAEQAKAKQAEAMAKLYGQYKGPLEQQKVDDKKIEAQNKIIAEAAKQGRKATFDANGQATLRPFTEEEIKNDPELRTKYTKELAYTNAAIARVRQGDVRNAIARARLDYTKSMGEKMYQLKLKDLDLKGAKVAQLSTHDKARMSQVYMAQDYTNKIMSIIQRRPDLFGAGDWGILKIKQALGHNDPDAVQLMADAKLLGLPSVGLHNSRSAKLAEDIQNFASNFYQDQNIALTSMQTLNDNFKDAEGSILKPYEIKAPLPGAKASPSPSAGATQEKDNDPLGILK